MPVWVVPNRTTAGLEFSAADRVFANMTELVAALQ
jgi:hypothetical protein